LNKRLIGSVGRSRKVIYTNLEILMFRRKREKKYGKVKGKGNEGRNQTFLLIFLLESFIL